MGVWLSGLISNIKKFRKQFDFSHSTYIYI